MNEATLVLVGNAQAGTVTVLELHEDGFTRVADHPVGVGCGAFAIDRTRGLVHTAVKEPEPAIVTLTLDRATGVLAEVGRRRVPDPLAYLSLTHDGRTLLGASYHGGWGAAWPVLDGRVGEVAGRVVAANVHCVVPDALGRYASWVSLGEDRVVVTALSDEGVLDVRGSASAPDGSGPRHLVLSGDDRSAYGVTEFTGEVIRYERDPESGLMERAESVSIVDPGAGLGVSRFGVDPRAEHLIWGADVQTAGFGAFVLASERTASTLAVVRVEEGVLGGVVGLIGTQAQPRGFAVTPDEWHVVVAGEASGAVSLYRLSDKGALTELDQCPTGAGANWVRFA